MNLINNQSILSEDNRAECSVSKNGKTYSLRNNSRYIIKQINVDNLLHQPIEEKKCDYLMIIDDKEIKRIFFIELKGGNLSKGVKQIMSTIKYLTNNIIGFRVDARIIGKGGNTPAFRNTPAYTKLSKRVKSGLGTLEIATNKFYTENI